MKQLRKAFAAVLALTLVLVAAPLTGAVSAQAATTKVYLTVGEKGTISSYGYFTQGDTNNPIDGAKWSSSKKSVVKITKKGIVTAKKKGTATIKAKQGKTKVFSAKVIVEKPSIYSKSVDMVPGQEAITLKVKGTKQDVSWSIVPKAEAENDLTAQYVNGYSESVVSLAPDYTNKTVCKVTPSATNVGDVVVKATVGRGNVAKSILKTTVHVALRQVDPNTITKQDYDYVTESGQYGTAVVLTNNNSFAVRSTVKLQFFDEKGYINMGGGESGITKVIEPGQKALFDCRSNSKYTRHEDTVTTTGSTVSEETDYVKNLHYWIQNGTEVSDKYKDSIVVTINTDDAKNCGRADFGVLLLYSNGSPYYVYANSSASFSNGNDRCIFTIPYQYQKDAKGNRVKDAAGNYVKIYPDFSKSVMCINKGYGRS